MAHLPEVPPKEPLTLKPDGSFAHKPKQDFDHAALAARRPHRAPRPGES